MKDLVFNSTLPKADNALPELEINHSKPDKEAPDYDFNDVGIRLICIPFFGLVIPNISALIHHQLYSISGLVLSYIYFIFIAFAIWQGNRFILFKLRQNHSWLNKPIQKIVALIFSNILYTLPLVAGSLFIWYQVSAEPAINWNAIQTAALICIICVIFITHVYELFYLARQWETHKQQNEVLQVTLNQYQIINQKINHEHYTPVRHEPSIKRLLVKSGMSLIPLEPAAIACFITKSKITFLKDFKGNEFSCDYNLSELEKMLDPQTFNRINRQVIVNVHAIESIRSHGKGKIKVLLNPAANEEIIISQENGTAFKYWLTGEQDKLTALVAE